jgi:hypothetical protein
LTGQRNFVPNIKHMKEKIHVVPHKKGWAVRKDGRERASMVAESKKDAERYGIDMATSMKTELVIHDRHGVIINTNSYGRDPNPPRDRK